MNDNDVIQRYTRLSALHSHTCAAAYPKLPVVRSSQIAWRGFVFPATPTNLRHERNMRVEPGYRQGPPCAVPTTSRAARTLAREVAIRNAEVNDPHGLEHDIRLAMWVHSGINPDGYDPKRSRADRIAARQRIHRSIDRDFDRLSISLQLAAIENAS